MALPEPLLSMCRHTVVVEPYAGTGAFGERVYGAATSEAARVVGQRKIVKDAAGKEVVSTITVYVARDVVIDPRSRVTLPAGTFTGHTSQPPIVSTGYFPDATADGLTHSTIYL